MAPKKYYAIASGRKPGIYDNWTAAQAQVTGYPGAKFKGFPTSAEAAAWMKNQASGQTTPQGRSDSCRSTHLQRGTTTDQAMPSGEDTSPRNDEVTIYTDGGARYNPGPGGYGIVQIYNGVRKELSGGYKLTTNNRMELMGCIVALRELEHRDKPVTLYSDSSYVVNGIVKGWAKNWRKKGWIKSDKKPAVNPDLWAELLDLVADLQITFRWVKGHAGNPMNERCDELAVAAARQDGLPMDAGYKSNADQPRQKGLFQDYADLD